MRSGEYPILWVHFRRAEQRLPNKTDIFLKGLLRNMTKKFSILTVIVLVLLSVLITFQITFLGLNNKYARILNQVTADQAYSDKLASVDALYDQFYVGDVNDATLSDEIIRGYLRGTGDKYATYYSSEEFQHLMADKSGELIGIGVHLVYDNENQALAVVSVLPNSPAYTEGVKEKDLIVSIEGDLVSEITYSDAVAKLSGEEGTFANFSVVRNMTEELEFSVRRAKVTDITVSGRLYQTSDGTVTNIGIIRITEFDDTTIDQLKNEVQKLQRSGVDKIIYDVRNNPGGDLESIVGVLDYLLPEGPVMRSYDKAGNETVKLSDESSLNVKCAVLINNQTASAAELFAAALKDYTLDQRYDAVLVGVTTYGKGTMQSVIKLEDNSAVSISNQMYNPPYSDNYEGVGVKPDVYIEQSEEAAAKNPYLLDDDEDLQLLEAIKVLSEE